MAALASTTVAILAGGLGTRIRPVLGEVPKLLATMAGKPFLDHLLAWLAPHKPATILLCLGHGATLILDYVEKHALPVVTVVEPAPLGTAGALRFALAGRKITPLLVLNGDTMLKGDLTPFFQAHQESGALGSLLCVAMEECQRYGTLTLDETQRIVRFVEKDEHHQGGGFISSGILYLQPPLVEALLASQGNSLERDFLACLPAGTLLGYPVAWPFIDFGVPDSYYQADDFFSQMDTVGGNLLP
ncbi:MAG: NTP transferase domain-containing protein [Magnetococcales bacterium]|nr:NTP transferase domain-containing protein [Magnetococcales bacterium]